MSEIIKSYENLFDFYDHQGIKFERTIEYLQPLVISTQKPFKIKAHILAQLGDSYISHLVTVALIDAGYEPGNVQLFLSTNLSNKVFAKYVDHKGWAKYCSTWDGFKNDKIFGTFFESVLGFFYLKKQYAVLNALIDGFFEWIEETTGDSTMIKQPKRVQFYLELAWSLRA